MTPSKTNVGEIERGENLIHPLPAPTEFQTEHSDDVAQTAVRQPSAAEGDEVIIIFGNIVRTEAHTL